MSAAKTILITGSTDGIGRLTAQKLSALGHHVIIHGRNTKRLQSVVAEMPGSFGVQCDLSDLSEVEKMAQSIKSKYKSIDILINNAGVFKTLHPTTSTGHDVRFVVNTVAPYLLTKRLLDIIPKSGRIINLSSAAQSSVNIKALRGEQPAGADFAAYGQSKLAITAWTRHWALQLKRGGGPLMLSVNPGSLLGTKMVQEGFGTSGNDVNIGADILVSLALDLKHEAHAGDYFDNDNRAYGQPHRDSLNPKISQKIIQTMEEMLP